MEGKQKGQCQMRKVTQLTHNNRADRRRKHPYLSFNINGTIFNVVDMSMGGCKLEETVPGSSQMLKTGEEYTAYTVTCRYPSACSNSCNSRMSGQNNKISNVTMKVKIVRVSELGKTLGVRFMRLSSEQFDKIDSFMSCMGKEKAPHPSGVASILAKIKQGLGLASPATPKHSFRSEAPRGGAAKAASPASLQTSFAKRN